MKLNFGKRFVLFLHWLMSLIACALVAGLLFRPDIVWGACDFVNNALGAGLAEIAGIVAAAVYVLLAVLSIVFIFSRDKGKKRGERGFITVDSSESGRTRIAIGAVEQMIRQAVRTVDGITDMKSSIVNGEDSISINTSVAISSGAHVPTVTMNIQRAIRSYIELNCGVAVREVCVSVNTLSGDEAGKNGRKKAASVAVPAAPAYQMPAVEEPKADEAVTDAAPVMDAPAAAEEAGQPSDCAEEAAEENEENKESE